MRRQARVIVAMFALALIAACARHDDSKVKSDLRSAGHDIKGAAADVRNDPDVKRAEAQFRAAGHDAAHDLRKAAAEAKAAARSLATDARRAGHEVTRPTGQDQRDRSEVAGPPGDQR